MKHSNISSQERIQMCKSKTIMFQIKKQFLEIKHNYSKTTREQKKEPSFFFVTQTSLART